MTCNCVQCEFGPEMEEHYNDPANWDCCDEHETVFLKGNPCPKCVPPPTEPYSFVPEELSDNG